MKGNELIIYPFPSVSEGQIHRKCLGFRYSLGGPVRFQEYQVDLLDQIASVLCNEKEIHILIWGGSRVLPINLYSRIFP